MRVRWPEPHGGLQPCKFHRPLRSDAFADSVVNSMTRTLAVVAAAAVAVDMACPVASVAGEHPCLDRIHQNTVVAVAAAAAVDGTSLLGLGTHSWVAAVALVVRCLCGGAPVVRADSVDPFVVVAAAAGPRYLWLSSVAAELWPHPRAS